MQFWKLLGVLLYWLTWPLIVVYAAMSAPRTRVLLIHGDQVLAVKNWLGNGGWALPGGGLHRGEESLTAALRELHEELGITLEPEAVTNLGRHVSVSGLLRNKYFLFAARLPNVPTLVLQKFEIMEASWLPITEIKPNAPGLTVTLIDSVQVWSDSQNLV